MLNKYDSLNANLESQLTHMEGELSSLVKDSSNEILNKKLDFKFDSVMESESSTTASLVEKPKNQLSAIVSSVINEEKDKAQCRLNLIVHNVPKSQDAGMTRRVKDINFA